MSSEVGSSEERVASENRAGRPPSFGKQIPATFFPEMGLERLYGAPPSPWVYLNHRVSGKSIKNLWGTISCGQNLDTKELGGLMLLVNSRNGTNALSAHRHGLGDDR